MRTTYLYAAVIAVAAVGWVLSGPITGGSASHTPETETETVTPPAAIPSVRVARLTAESMTRAIVLQGRTAAARTVELRAEVRGRIEAILVERGAVVRQGQPILRLAVDDRKTDLEQARALLAQRALELEAARTLSRKGFKAEVGLAQAQAQYDAARATVARAEVVLANTVVRAPFDGVLDKRSVELGNYVDSGDRIATLVDLDPVKVVGQVSEREVGQLHLGKAGEARLSGGAAAPGLVSYIAASADPTTRTFRVELSVPNPDRRIVDGLTAQLRIPLEPRPAHRLPPSVLTLADDGTIGVKILEEGNRVRFLPVQILGDDADGVWLGGLPEAVTVVVVGQEFVAAGQTVAPTFVDRNHGVN